jgi:SecD/SecF fusion protein
MKLKGFVWFFTISLILISLWELSYTWVIKNHENDVKAQATRLLQSQTAGLPSDQKEAMIRAKTQRILDSTKNKEIFLGASYQKCKENELNLGLDLQGGISVTLDVSLEGLLKSLSNNPKDPELLKAIATASAEKSSKDADYITLFSDAFIKNNGKGKLSAIFAGSGKEIKIGDNDEMVINKIRKTSKDAINQTFRILTKRIDKFGVSQPNINLDENKGVINVELAGITDAERVRKYLQSSANLQFWEVYRIDELATSLKAADENLQKYLNGISTTDTTAKDSATAAADSALNKKNLNPFFSVMNPIDVQTDSKGKQFFAPAIGRVAMSDTALFNSYLQLDVVKNSLRSNMKFLYGVEEKSDKGNVSFFSVYAVKLMPGSDKARLEGNAIEEATQGFDEFSRPSINMKMNSNGARVWANLTKANVGRPIAISLDDVVYTAPNVNNAIENGSSEISGSFTVEEAQDLANILKSGKLDAPAKIVAEQVVGPTLGKEAVAGGAKSFLFSFIVIFLLMLLYYNTSGWIANIALILNLLFTIGILTAMGLTLTAAGIAGLVLTIGMAVDTNVIIFERIKDELSKGKQYTQAVSDGYKRSLPPVIDAHVTSLLTAIILAYFGLGPVLGFATTQIIGILLSLFCGIMVSRLFTDIWTNKHKHLNYFTGISKRLFKHANFKFIEYRKIAYGVFVVVLIAGIASFFHGFDYGVEFMGGRSYTVSFPSQVKNDQVRESLKAAFGENPIIKTVGDAKHLNITTSYLKGENNADSLVQSKLFEGLKSVLPAGIDYRQFVDNHIQSSTTVQPSISDDLKRGAIKATIFAIFIIFIYIFVRFRDWRYSLGTIVTLLHDVLVTLAVFSFLKDYVPFSLEIDQHFIAAVLTVIGFSMNDTVIVFDRIREYSREMRNSDKTTIINKAINDTLSRTIMTSLTVFLTILILFIFGGEVTRGFAFAMLIGVFTGTYSSIFVGAPILVDFAKDKPLGASDDSKKK